MSKRRYHRRSKMKPRRIRNGSQNGSKNGSKMAPKWLQNGSLEARPLGGPWARPCCQTLPGAVPERLWHGPGRPKKFILAALERPWSEKWIDFTLLEGPREGPGEGLRGHLGSFLAVGPAGTKKSRKVTKKSLLLFLKLFLHAFSCISRVCSVRLGARRRESTT